jgi:hypothetical protein
VSALLSVVELSGSGDLQLDENDGDSFLSAVCTSTFSELLKRCGYSRKRSDHAKIWANQFAHLIEDYSIPYLNSGLIHLWHGLFSNKRYRERQKLLKNLDPERDLEAADFGAWQWQNPQSDLAQSVAQYFYSRSEGG